jgi:8-oxo-dGTP pyrophosphatase MutT (NUDIX family)
MDYTIYFKEKPLLLTENKTLKATELLQKPGTILQENLSNETVQTMLRKMQESTTTAGIFLHTPVDELLRAFKRNMTVIEAGGGLVHTDVGTVLLIFRNGKWDLPKGKIDEGESASAAALREVYEETGLNQLQLEAPLTTTYHTYHQNENLILKESHWFLMKSPQQQTMIPQLEEGIEKCEWVKLDVLATYLENTHPSIIDVLKLGIEKLHAAKTI